MASDYNKVLRVSETADQAVRAHATAESITVGEAASRLILRADSPPPPTRDPMPDPLLVPLTRYADGLDLVAAQEGCGEETRERLQMAARLIRGDSQPAAPATIEGLSPDLARRVTESGATLERVVEVGLKRMAALSTYAAKKK